MKLIVGLGNPGKKYEKTRHNVGFRVVDLLASRWGVAKFESAFQAELAKAGKGDDRKLLLKPQTFMNLSGSSVLAASGYHRVDTGKDLWIVHDDLDLPTGHLRIRHGGSAGGHNGVKSVIERLGTQAFWRVRIGIGRPAEARVPIEDYVVQHPLAAEQKALEAAIVRAADALEVVLKEGPERAMNLYNRAA